MEGNGLSSLVTTIASRDAGILVFLSFMASLSANAVNDLLLDSLR